jgi:oligosaccharide translocation protein RFT1
MSSDDAGATVAQAFSGTRYIMFSNIFQRACTFCLNQVMVRSSGPEIFGLASVELELLLSTLLYLSR